MGLSDEDSPALVGMDWSIQSSTGQWGRNIPSPASSCSLAGHLLSNMGAYGAARQFQHSNHSSSSRHHPMDFLKHSTCSHNEAKNPLYNLDNNRSQFPSPNHYVHFSVTIPCGSTKPSPANHSLHLSRERNQSSLYHQSRLGFNCRHTPSSGQ